MEYPIYLKSEPPNDRISNVGTLYYKVLSENGNVFVRAAGDETGRSEEWIDLLFEEMYGFGLEEVSVEETPWKNE